LEEMKKSHGYFSRSPRRRISTEGEPKPGDLVIFETITVTDFAAKVSLLEYEAKEGVILLHDEGKHSLKWGEIGVGFVRRNDAETSKTPIFVVC